MSQCLVPDCRSETIHLRGLCRSCYLYAAQLVFHRLTSWDAMENAGCIAGTNGQVQSPKRPIRTDWFSRATGMTPDGMKEELRRRVGDYEKRRRRKRGNF